MLLKRVVVAEDDEALAHLLGATLGDAGFLCLRARDGEEALALVGRELPDLLVLDLMLPKVDGLVVARRLKADAILSQVPILMLTALSDVDSRVKGLDAGGDDYLGKPFDVRELVARVRALIRSSRRERDRNPVTGLPGTIAVEERVNELLRRKQPFAFLYLDVNPFEAYLDAAGWRRGEAIIGELGDVVRAQVETHAGSGEEVFVAHLGGDDFVVLCPSDRAEGVAEGVVRAFDQAIDRLAEENAPRLGVAIAILDAPAAGVSSVEEISRRVAECKRRALSARGSSITRWPRAGDRSASDRSD